jgi:hypothetical protein
VVTGQPVTARLNGVLPATLATAPVRAEVCTVGNTTVVVLGEPVPIAQVLAVIRPVMLIVPSTARAVCGAIAAMPNNPAVTAARRVLFMVLPSS